MAHYVDGFVLVIAKEKIEGYRRIAEQAGEVWREHGALEYRECIADDMDVPFGVPFPRLLELKPEETVGFAWIVFASRAERDRVNAAVMKDPRLKMDPESMPFDCQRMVYGGFETLVKR